MLHDRVGSEPLDKPFFVQWGWSDQGDWPTSANDDRFASLDEAQRRYDDLKDTPDLPVWLGEIGDYRTDAGPIRDWIYFAWNAPAAAAWGTCVQRGKGFPYGTWTRRIVSYTPFRS